MTVDQLNLSNFRNYEYEELSFSDRINIFYGDNAQGKTNILEAIYLCSTNKSYRGSRDRDLISTSVAAMATKPLASSRSRSGALET